MSEKNCYNKQSPALEVVVQTAGVRAQLRSPAPSAKSYKKI